MNYNVPACSCVPQAMYERVFGWVVNKINDSVQNELQTRDDIVIGVLDIYGFEIFNLNR